MSESSHSFVIGVIKFLCLALEFFNGTSALGFRLRWALTLLAFTFSLALTILALAILALTILALTITSHFDLERATTVIFAIKFQRLLARFLVLVLNESNAAAFAFFVLREPQIHDLATFLEI